MKRLSLILLVIFSIQSAIAQNTLDKLGLSSADASAVAYSLRLLSTNYTGPLVRININGNFYDVYPDNATAQFALTSKISAPYSTYNAVTTGATSNSLNTVSVGTNATVAIWYDQSGNGINLRQATTINQPRIINAGVIEVENNVPIIRFFGTVSGTRNSLDLPSAINTNGQVCVINKFSGVDGFLLGGYGNYNWHSYPGKAQLFDPTNASSSIRNSTIYQNGNLVTPNTALWNTSLGVNTITPQDPSVGTAWDNIGSDRATLHNTTSGGGYAELIVFAAALPNASKLILETNQISYTNIPKLDKLNLNIESAAAYALRLLRTNYTGKAIQVRRSSDNTTQDIGFDNNGNLDTLALKTFLGANNGLVTVWYDQSGNNRNLTQANIAKQPAIANAGKIYRRNGVPSVFHDAIDDGMLCAGSDYLSLNSVSVNIVASSNGDNVALRRAVQGTNNWLIGPYNNQHSWFAGNWNHQINTPWNTSSLETFTVIQPAINSNSSFRNGTSQITANFKGTPNKIQTGTEGGYTEPFNGFLSEILVFNTEISASNRKAFESNQGAYYGICLLDTQPSPTDQSVILGGTATSLNVLSDDSTATYQWYSNTIKANNGGTLLNGETSTSYTPNTSVEGTLYYYVVISTSKGTCVSDVSGFVRTGINITSQPSTTIQTLAQNSTATALSITVTGSNLTYQWYKNSTNSNIGGTLIDGATANTYTPLTTELGTNYYYAVITGRNTILTSNVSGSIEVLASLPTIWNGPSITFTKVAGADYALAANQDSITNNVTITKGNSSSDGLINIVKEVLYNISNSPEDTEWALVGSNNLTVSQINAQTFTTFRSATRFSGSRITLNRYFLVHLITDDIYLYIKILSWNTSGGFSYERSTKPNLPQAVVVTKSGESTSPKATSVDKNGALNTTKGVTKNGEIKVTK